MQIPKPLLVAPNYLDVINGRVFPERTEYLRFKSVSPLAQALRECLIFGPGLIPPAIAETVALEARTHQKVTSLESFYYTLQEATFSLRAARPESRPVAFAVERLSVLVRHIMDRRYDQQQSLAFLEKYAETASYMISRAGDRIAGLIAENIPQHTHVMVIGGSGSMSAVGRGTGVAGLIEAHRQGKEIKAVTPYSTPLFSGPRLTAWELRNAGIDCEIIADTVIGTALMTEKFDAVLVIANRLCANGDVSCPSGANHAALAAKYMGVPYYVIVYDHIVDTGCPSLATCPMEDFKTSEALPSIFQDVRHYINDLVAAEWVTGYITCDGLYRPKNDGPASELANKLDRKMSAQIKTFIDQFGR